MVVCENYGYGGQCMARSGALGGWGHITLGCHYVSRGGDPVPERQRECPDYKRRLKKTTIRRNGKF